MPHVILVYGYDKNGNRTSVSDNAGVRVDSTYDDRNQLQSRTWQGGGVDPLRVDFGYYANGAEKTVDRYADLSGVDSESGAVPTGLNPTPGFGSTGKGTATAVGPIRGVYSLSGKESIATFPGQTPSGDDASSLAILDLDPASPTYLQIRARVVNQ